MNAKSKTMPRVLAFLMAMLLVFGGIIPTQTVYAQDTGEATVTLTEAEHGKLFFAGDEETTRVVSSGEEVIVQVHAEEGYRATHVLKTEGDESEKLEIIDNKVSFVAKHNATLSIRFVEGGPIDGLDRASDFQEADVKETAQEYIKRVANKNYVGDGDLVPFDELLSSYTLVEDGKLPINNFDNLWKDEDGDGYSEYWTAMIGQHNAYVTMYSLSDDAEYAVGLFDTFSSPQMSIEQFLVAENDGEADMKSGFIFDKETGLVYMPKSERVYDEQTETVLIGGTRAQGLVIVKGEAKTKDAAPVVNTEVEVLINSKRVKGDVFAEGLVTSNILADTTMVRLTNDEEAKKSMSIDSITSVKVNGRELAEGQYRYDDTQGVVEIASPAMTVKTVELEITNPTILDNIFQAIVNLFVPQTVKANPNMVLFGEPWTVSQFPTEGATLIMPQVENSYVGQNNPYYPAFEGLYLPASRIAGGRGFIAPPEDFIRGIINNTYTHETGDTFAPISMEYLTDNGHTYGPAWRSTIPAANYVLSDGTTLETVRETIYLQCAHIGVPRTFDRIVPGKNSSVEQPELFMRVVSVGTDATGQDYMVLGFTTATTHTQAGTGLYRIPLNVAQPAGNVEIQKTTDSRYTGMVTGNNKYNFTGIEYGVYSTQALAQAGGTPDITTLVLDATGKASKTEVAGLTQGQPFYARETKTNAVYTLNPAVITGTWTDDVLSFVATDIPVTDPMYIVLRKVDENGQPITVGPSLAGAEFTVDFFAGSNPVTGTPTRSWVYTTDANGVIDFSNATQKTGGDALYLLPGNEPTIPLGTIVIRETKAPEGYMLGTGYLRAGQEITTENRLEINHQTAGKFFTVIGGNQVDINNSEVQVTEPLGKAGLKIQKHIMLADGTTTTTPPGNTTVGPLTYRITNLNTYPVNIGGETVAPNFWVDVVTNTAGYYESPADFLSFGMYRVDEMAAGTGLHVVGTWTFTTTVGTISDFTVARPGENVNSPFYGDLSLQKVDADTGQPIAQGDGSLAGATFDVINRSAAYVVTRDGTFQPGEVVTTITTDANGKAGTIDKLLPYGNYEVIETGAPVGYKLTLQGVGQVNITQDGEVYGYHGNIVIEGHEDKVFEPIIRGGVKGFKWDIDLKRATPQGNATLGNAVFEIINESNGAVQVNGQSIAPGEVALEVSTLDDGSFSVAQDILPYGSYRVREITAPNGYLNTGVTEHTFEIREDGVVVDLGAVSKNIENTPIRGGFKIRKWDSETQSTDPQGDGTFSDVFYTVINRSVGPVFVNGVEHAPGAEIMKHQSNGQGYFELPAVLPFGDYEVVESQTPTGYLPEGRTIAHFTIANDGEIIDLTPFEQGMVNDVIRGGVKLQKRDLESGMARPLGGAKLDAEFTLVNKSTHYVMVNGERFEPGDVIMSVVADGATGIFETANDLLPYGTYEVTETKEPTGYLPGEGTTHTFQIREDGVIVDMSGQDDSFFNQVKRGDFYLRKIASDTQRTMAFVSFKITSKTTGESHEFMTDINGEYYSESAWNAHTHDTNGGNWDSGLWFGQYVDDEGNIQMTEVNDSLGALPYDTYLIEELDTPAVKGYELWSGELTIDRHGYTVKLNNIENTPMPQPPSVEIGTTLTTVSGSKIVPLVEEVELIDVIRYSGVQVGKEYTAKGTLMSYNDKAAVSETFEVVFTPEASEGTVSVPMTIAYADIKDGDKLVAFEELWFEGELISEHKDFEDAGQTVTKASVGTKAVNVEDQTQIIRPFESVTIKDTVSYKGLELDKEYTVKGVLMIEETNGDEVKAVEFLDADGKPVYAETTFVAKSVDGEVDVFFTFNASGFDNKKVVVFEDLYEGEIKLATHADIKDEAQTVEIIELSMGTTLTTVDGGKVLPFDEKVELVDTIAYKGLTVGQKYVARGVLMSFNAQEAISEEFSVEFTPESRHGSVNVPMVIDSTKVQADDKVVAFEEIYLVDEDGSETLILEHKDYADVDQTVTKMSIGTKAIDKASGTQIIRPGTSVTIVDTIAYQGAEIGKEYIAKGILMTVETKDGEVVLDENGVPVAKVFLDADGKEVRSEATFTAEAVSGSVEVEFNFNASGVADMPIVVFEDVYVGDILFATHADITDKAQTVTITKLGMRTTLVGDNGSKLLPLVEDAKMVDTIAYVGLEAGKQYKAKGWLMSYKENKAVTDIFEVIFTPEGEVGTIEVPMTIDATKLAEDDKVVAFEEIYEIKADGSEELIVEHKDLEDVEQTMTKMVLRTKLNSKLSVSHVMELSDAVILVDEISYKGAIVGETYKFDGVLMTKDGKVFVDGADREARGSVEFVAESTEGSVFVEFKLNMRGKSLDSLVAFESGYNAQGQLVAQHADLTDKDQTVSRIKIGTLATAKDGKSKEVPVSTATEIIDTIAYEGLPIGQKVIVRGYMVDKTANGKVVSEVVTKEFVAEHEKGTMQMSLFVNTTALADHELVAYEYVYVRTSDGRQVLIAKHEDINDKGQTVVVKTKPTVVTFAEENAAPLAGVALATLILGAGTFIIIRKKRKEETGETLA